MYYRNGRWLQYRKYFLNFVATLTPPTATTPPTTVPAKAPNVYTTAAIGGVTVNYHDAQLTDVESE